MLFRLHENDKLFTRINTNPGILVNSFKNLYHVLFSNADTSQRVWIAAITVQKYGRPFSINILFIVIKNQRVIVLRNISDQMLTIIGTDMINFTDVKKLIIVLLVAAQIHRISKLRVRNKEPGSSLAPNAIHMP